MVHADIRRLNAEAILSPSDGWRKLDMEHHQPARHLGGIMRPRADIPKQLPPVERHELIASDPAPDPLNSQLIAEQGGDPDGGAGAEVVSQLARPLSVVRGRQVTVLTARLLETDGRLKRHALMMARRAHEILARQRRREHTPMA